MSHFLSRICVVVSLLVTGSLRVADAADSRSRSASPAGKVSTSTAIDSYIASQLPEKGFVGLSLAIARDGKILSAKGYGKSFRFEPGLTRRRRYSPFAVGSITKQFACACILLLAEDGKLSVKDPVVKYYPALTRAKDITLYDLMTHVSGYPDYYPLDFIDRRMLKSLAADGVVTEYAGRKLDFEPGSRWSYSNTGYMILGRVVEKVSHGESFDKFLPASHPPASRDESLVLRAGQGTFNRASWRRDTLPLLWELPSLPPWRRAVGSTPRAACTHRQPISPAGISR